jgi:DNA-binding transcriptional LysR family regulator
VSQPSLTTAIKKLEEEMGGALFIRDRAGCRLTQLGKLVQPRLARVLAETREAKAAAIRHTRLDRVPIGLGIGETIGQSTISKAMERFRARLPQAEIELIVGPAEELFSELREGNFDVVVTAQNVSLDLYHIDILYREEYLVVIAKDHPLAKLDSISLANLANTNMLDRPNCEMRDTIHASCADLGHVLYAAYRSNRVDWLLDLARQGSGAVILPSTAIPEDDGLVALPIEGIEIAREVKALRYRHQTSRPETNELVREILRG